MDLYGLIHARYIISPRGLTMMREKYVLGTFGSCQRILCDRQLVLPIGLSEELSTSRVKVSFAVTNITWKEFLVLPCFLYQLIWNIIFYDSHLTLFIIIYRLIAQGAKKYMYHVRSILILMEHTLAWVSQTSFSKPIQIYIQKKVH